MGICILPYLGDLRKYAGMPIQQFAAGFSDPFLRCAFGAVFDMPDFPMLAMLMTLAWMHIGDAGYPIGGSLPFSQAIVDRYRRLGGQIHYKSPVEKILVESTASGGAWCLWCPVALGRRMPGEDRRYRLPTATPPSLTCSTAGTSTPRSAAITIPCRSSSLSYRSRWAWHAICLPNPIT